MRYRRIDVELLNKEMSEFTVVRHTQDIMAKKYFMGMKIQSALKRIYYFVVYLINPFWLIGISSAPRVF